MPAPPIDRLPLSAPVFHILLSLVDQDLHGYAITRDIAARTGGEVQLTASTLYGALARLLDSGFIDELEPDAVAHLRRRRYALTRAGRALLQQEVERLARAAKWARDKRLLPRTS